MSPLRLKAVLLAGQARLPKIGTKAGAPKEPHLLKLRQLALQRLLPSLETIEERHSCHLMLQHDNLLLTMPEIDFRAYLRGEARSTYTQAMHDADALLSVGRPSRSESLEAAKAMRKRLQSEYLKALFRLSPLGRDRSCRSWRSTSRKTTGLPPATRSSNESSERFLTNIPESSATWTIS